MNFIKKHLTALIVTFVCLILFILAAFAVYRMFYPSNDKSVHGDRAAGSPNVTDVEFTTVLEKINETGNINNITWI